MRRRPDTVIGSTSFDRVLKSLGEGHLEILPVLGTDGRFEGVISYDEVKNALYDPALRDLVIAEDLTESVEDPLDPDSTLAEALETMDRHGVSSWPVVHDGRLLGIVRRSDVYALMRRGLRRRRRQPAGR